MAYIGLSQYNQHDEYEYDDVDDFYDDSNHINNINSNSYEAADDSEGNLISLHNFKKHFEKSVLKRPHQS